MITTDVCILGAGPGGVAAALQLDKLGVDCLLLDKATFPRDKVCGDAISGKVIWAFNRINEEIFREFRFQHQERLSCWGIEFIFPNQKVLSVPFKHNLEGYDLSSEKPVGYVAKRWEFDHFLIGQVHKSEHVTLHENADYTEVREEVDGLILSGKSVEEVKTKLLIVANGAQSKIARKLSGIQVNKKHHAGAIRAYVKGMKGMHRHNFIELHFIKEFMPGYFWIFPLPNGEANVGVGMRSDLLGKSKVNLRKELEKLMKEHPRFKERFEGASLEGDIKGYPLPLGSRKVPLSGNRFMLVGDAGSLIDPLTGEGIGNAATSGWQAGIYAAEALKQDRFDAAFLKTYDKQVYKYLWTELQISHQLQRMFKRSWLVSLTSSIALRNKRFVEIITSMFTDVDMRKKLTSPKFYFQLLLNR